MTVQIRVQMTPNPNAWKFVLDQAVLNEGKATFNHSEEALGNSLAGDLLEVPGVKQVHLFQNVITITGNLDCDAEELQKQAIAIIEARISTHDPNWAPETAKKKQRKALSPEAQQIEHILDRTVRPGLQGDGGDIEILQLEGKKLYVHYEGACGTCPSATSGTLMAIEGILRDELDPEIEVIPV